MKNVKKSSPKWDNFGLVSQFRWKILIICILFDAIDYGLDAITTLTTSIGIGSGLFSALGDSINYLMLVVGFIIFYLFGKDNMSIFVFLPVFADPIFEEIYPSYTLMYMFTVINGWRQNK